MSILILESPYPGLRPFNENERAIFFGRERDKAILVDKILANHLTLLFAASGVGKSSLLNASVIPYLKSPLVGENLAVAYVSDWVSDPYTAIEHAVIKAVEEKGFLNAPKVSFSTLKELVGVYSSFCRAPLVLILDQFEEFFRYHHNAKKSADSFIEQLVDIIKCDKLPISIILSMREDFALELNVLKKKLPVTLFDNFYRLERLSYAQLKMVISEPLKQIGWKCEDGLAEDIIKELSEGKIQISTTGDKTANDFFENRFELGYLQVVCGFLWEKSKNDRSKIIRYKLYTDYQGVVGILGEYLKGRLDSLSSDERYIAYRFFDFLVGPPGFKVAYTVPTLSHILGIKGRYIESVLNKVVLMRILRAVKLSDDIYYQLSHDMYARLIIDWKSKWRSSREYQKAAVKQDKVYRPSFLNRLSKYIADGVLLILAELNEAIQSVLVFIESILLGIYRFFEFFVKIIFDFMTNLILSFIRLLERVLEVINICYSKVYKKINDFRRFFRYIYGKINPMDDMYGFLLFFAAALYYIDFAIVLDDLLSFIKGFF